MKIKTSELIGIQLNWAVAQCENVSVRKYPESPTLFYGGGFNRYSPSTDWAQGGPIIERGGISIRYSEKDARGAWYAVLGPNRFLSPDHEGSGPTPLTAAMRCYVASKLGDMVDIPDNLV